jgi:response regulator RpfG family c-di-GMP phosphodiesterase
MISHDQLMNGMPRPDGDNYRILVLDENIERINAITLACQLIRQEVVPVKTIAEGMNFLLTKDHVDVVVSEVYLQNESVFDLLKKLKSLPHHSKVPVILLAVNPGAIASFLSESVAEVALVLGAYKFLVMPDYDVERLMKEIAAVLPRGKPPKKDQD